MSIYEPTILRFCSCGSGRLPRSLHDYNGRYIYLGCDKCEIEARIRYELDGPAVPVDTD